MAGMGRKLTLGMATLGGKQTFDQPHLASNWGKILDSPRNRIEHVWLSVWL